MGLTASPGLDKLLERFSVYKMRILIQNRDSKTLTYTIFDIHTVRKKKQRTDEIKPPPANFLSHDKRFLT